MNKLQCVEFHTFYDVPVHCPFCGADPQASLLDGGKTKPCSHTLFSGCEEGWMQLADRAELQLRKKGFEIDRDSDAFILIYKSNEDEEDVYIDNQEIYEAISFPDSVVFEQYIGAPSGMYIFTAFAGVEEDGP